MKKLILATMLLSTFISCRSLKPEGVENAKNTDNFAIQGKTWRSNSLIGLIDASKIELSDDVVKEGQSPFYNGAKIAFNSDGTFKSYNTAQCGNDCFITVKGSYLLLKDSKIEIKTEDIQKGQYCDNNTVFKNSSYVYTLQQSGEIIILTK